MNKLAIVGSGGHGRCCLDIARAMNNYEEIIFLDDANVGADVNGAKIIGTVSDVYHLDKSLYELFVAIGNNEVRRRIMQELMGQNYEMATLISPYSMVSEYATIKAGTVIYPGAVVEPNSFIGEGCIITSHVAINHDAVVGDYSIIYYNSVIRPTGRVKELSKINCNEIIEV